MRGPEEAVFPDLDFHKSSVRAALPQTAPYQEQVRGMSANEKPDYGGVSVKIRDVGWLQIQYYIEG
jgi:hypothetical protein